MLSSMFRFTHHCNHLRIPTQSFLRQYAAASKASRPPLKPISRTQQTSKLPSNSPRTKEDYFKVQRVDLATKIYESGQKELYRAPQRLTIFRANSFAIATLCFGAVFGYGFNRLLDPEEAKKRGFSVWITGAYWLVSFALCSFGYIVMLQTRSHIEAISLMKRAGSVFVRISVRSMVPFRKYEKIIPPYDVHIGRELVLMAETPHFMQPEDAVSSGAAQAKKSMLKVPLRVISRFFYSIFSAARQFLAQDGILKIAVAEGKGKEKRLYKVDVDGSWYRQEGKSLPAFFEVGTMDDSEVD